MQLITREFVRLRYFDNIKEVTLQRDIPDCVFGAIIIQEGHPAAFISRASTNIEKFHALTGKELFSIIHGCTRFDQHVDQ